MGHDSNIVAGSDSAQQYQQMSENLQFLLIRGPSGSHTSVPLCARVLVKDSAGTKPSVTVWMAAFVAVVVSYGMI